jgi:hypothetical protein
MEITGQMPQIQKSIIPQFYSRLEDIAIEVGRSPHRLLAKAPYSSSGRGLLWLPQTGLTRTENQILHGMLKKQGSVSIERVLNKTVDFAMEFLTDGAGNVQFAGYSLFKTNNKGAYESNCISSQKNIEAEITRNISQALPEEVKQILTGIIKKKFAHLYKGCIGVDMMIYTEGEEYYLHPCVEINMRYNMGYLALKLSENYIMSGKRGYFRVDYHPQEGRTYHEHITMLQTYPVIFKDGRIVKGYLPLCPVNKHSRYTAYILVC